MNKNLFRQIVGYLVGGTVFIFLIPFGVSLVARRFDPYLGVNLIPNIIVRLILANILGVLGIAFSSGALVAQNVWGKGGPLEGLNVTISPKTQRLVVKGPYRYTRNPMLFGTCMYYFGLALSFNSVTGLAGVALFMILMLVYIKLCEEKRLLRDFGEEYETYRKRVSLFIPCAPKRKL
jgi:protein-S-isoprenylcysteine O-methyltransferase Ste14